MEKKNGNKKRLASELLSEVSADLGKILDKRGKKGFERGAADVEPGADGADVPEDEKDLFGDSVNGKLVGITKVKILIPLVIHGVKFYTDGTGENQFYRLVYKNGETDINADGKTPEEATKEFRKKYKKTGV